jgi:hypothetical protein
MKLRSPHLLVTLVVASLAGSAGSHSTGVIYAPANAPPIAETANADGCAVCHTGAASASDEDGDVELRGLPEHYTPGKRYTVTFTVRHSGEQRLRWGFMVTAVSADTHRPAGRLVVTDRINTQASTSPEGGGFVTHTYPGTAIGRSKGHSWSFDWFAPEYNTGGVVFLGAGVAADADGTEQGDLVYGSTFEEPLAVVHELAPEPSPNPPMLPTLEQE